MLQRDVLLHSRYQIESVLGQGGFGTVYRAIDTRLSHQVAVKEMQPQPDIEPALHAKLRKQFHREAQTLAKLQHNHLVNVTDYFTEAGNDYLVMRFVTGQSLEALIEQQGALPVEQVRMWAIQLLNALEYCHKHNVLHRDIKPGNIIIRENGQAVLVDFGLVKLWDPSDPRTTVAIQGYGTPAYAPPEQAIQHGNHTDARSDLYSFGATLYHALTGQTPPSVSERMATPEHFRSVQELSPYCDPTFADAVMKAMKVARSARFESAAAMQTALTQTTTEMLPASSSPGSRRVAPTNFVIGGLVGLVLLMAALLWRGRSEGRIVVSPTAALVAIAEDTTSTPTPDDSPTTETLSSTATNTPPPTETLRPSPTSTKPSTTLPTDTIAPTSTPSPRPSNTPTRTPRPTNTRTSTPRPTTTRTPTQQPTALPIIVPSATPTPRPTSTRTPTPRPTNTVIPTNTLNWNATQTAIAPTNTPTPTNTPRPTNTTVAPTATPVPTPTAANASSDAPSVSLELLNFGGPPEGSTVPLDQEFSATIRYSVSNPELTWWTSDSFALIIKFGVYDYRASYDTGIPCGDGFGADLTETIVRENPSGTIELKHTYDFNGPYNQGEVRWFKVVMFAYQGYTETPEGPPVYVYPDWSFPEVCYAVDDHRY